MNENKEQVEFLQWLSTNVEEFADKTPEEIVNTLNELYQTPEGQEQVVNLIKSFKDSKKKTSKFAKGGKLDYLVTKYQNGNPFKVKMNLKIKGQSPLNEDVETFEKGNKVKVSPKDKEELGRFTEYVVMPNGEQRQAIINELPFEEVVQPFLATVRTISPDKRDTIITQKYGPSPGGEFKLLYSNKGPIREHKDSELTLVQPNNIANRNKYVPIFEKEFSGREPDEDLRGYSIPIFDYRRNLKNKK